MSRYGIQVTEEQVKTTILKDFGQSESHRKDETKANASARVSVFDADDDYSTGNISSQQNNINRPAEHLDLTQVLALLLIPTLLKAKVKLEEGRANEKNGAKPALNNAHTLTGQTPDAANDRTNNMPTIQISQQQPKTTHFRDDKQNPNESNPQNYKPKRWTINQCEKGGAHHPDSDLIENVLEMMLHDATGTITPQPLTKELLRKLLMFYGEPDMADDDALLDEMIAVATEGAAEDVEGNPVMLDKYTFARALTNDVGLYKIENEESVTTNYQDVFQTSTPIEPKKSHTKDGLCEEEVQPVKTVFTYQSIDYTADTFRSKSFVILLWVTWILSYFACRYLLAFELQCSPRYHLLTCLHCSCQTCLIQRASYHMGC